MKKVLYICNEDLRIGGASLSLMDMLQSLEGKVEPILLFRQEGPAAELFRQAGYNCVVIPFRRATFHAKGLVRVLRFLPHAITTAIVQWRCVRKCRQRFAGIDAVHSNSGTVDIGLRIAAALKVPHIWHIREYMDLGLHTAPFPSWGRWKREISRSDAVIAISPGLYRHLGLERHRNGICLPDAVCSAADSVLETPKEKYVAFVSGTLSAVKRPDEALRIFAAAKPEGYTLKLVGNVDESMKAGLQQLAAELGVASSLEFLPFTRDIKGLLSKAAATLVCTDFEGMGRVCIEAMFYGCPVVARDSGGSSDLLAEGRGYLYKDLSEAAAALREVLDTFPEAVAEKARQYALTNFVTEDYANKILTIYNAL